MVGLTGSPLVMEPSRSDARSAPRRHRARDRRHAGTIIALTAVVAAACTPAGPEVADPVAPSPATSPSPSPVREYPDAIVRRLNLLAAEDRPVEDSAMPPRHLDEDRFPTSLVERTRIVSGGPPPDGIRSIDDPVFEPVHEVDWLESDEAVLSLELDGVARAYPVRILMWHEIVNDRIGDLPVAVTYCPLCNSAVAFERRTEHDTLEFGTSGALYQSALVMYDRGTESLWTHFDGLAVVGTLVGTELTRVPVATIPWEEFRSQRPDGQVLSRDTGFERDYGRNPYIGYENIDRPLTGFVTGETDPRLAPMARVIGVGEGPRAVAVDTVHSREVGVVDLEVQGRPVTVWHVPGLASSLDQREVAEGRDVGATGAFFVDGPADPREFQRRGDGFVDAETGSTWNILGHAVEGPMAGHRLEPAVHLDTFWFAWSSYVPDTRLVSRPDRTG